jgi:hypothetical protein
MTYDVNIYTYMHVYLLIASPGPSPVGSHTLLGSLPLFAAAMPPLAAAAAPVSAADESRTARSAVAPTRPPVYNRLRTIHGQRLKGNDHCIRFTR